MRTLNNSKGFTIIQALVGAFIAALVALGVSTMMVNSKIQTRKITLLNTLKEQKTRIEFLLRDQTAFDQTLNGALNSSQLFVSLRGASLATEQDYATSATKLVIYDSSGAVLYDMLNRISTGLPASANGLTEKGNPCATFNANPGSGNDDCPISYRILMGADCPGAATTCLDPQLKIVARLIFNPSASGYSQLNKFRTLIPTSSTGTDSISNAIVDGRYDAVIKRTASSIARSFKLSASFTPVSGTGVGTCATAGFVHHPLVSASGWVEDFDPHDLVSPTSGGVNGYLVFRETGYYNCALTAPAYGVGGFSIRLYNVSTTTAVGTGSSVAPTGSESIGRLDVAFNASSTSQPYRAEIKCDATSGLSFDLGVSKAPYSGSTPIVVLSCSKIDTSF